MMLIETCAWTLPAAALIVTVPGVLSAWNVLDTKPAVVVPELLDMLPRLVLSTENVTAVPSATGFPISSRTSAVMVALWLIRSVDGLAVTLIVDGGVEAEMVI